MRDSRDISRPVSLNECFRLTTLVSAVPPESVGAAMALQAPHDFTEFIPTGREGEAAPQPSGRNASLSSLPLLLRKQLERAVGPPPKEPRERVSSTQARGLESPTAHSPWRLLPINSCPSYSQVAALSNDPNARMTAAGGLHGATPDSAQGFHQQDREQESRVESQPCRRLLIRYS